MSFALRQAWASGPLTAVGLVAVPIVQALIPAALALVLRGLINAVVDASDSAGEANDVLLWVLLSFVLAVALANTSALNVYLSQRNTEYLTHRLATDLLEHAETLPFEVFENPQFRDTLTFAGQNPAQHTHALISRSMQAISGLLTVVSLLIVLAQIEFRLLLLLLPLSIPYFVFRNWLSRGRFEQLRSQARRRRWVSHFTEQLMSDVNLPETRTLRLGPLFVSRIEDRLLALRGQNMAFFRRENAGSVIFNTLAVVAVHIALYLAATRAVDGDLTIGDIAVFAGAATGVRTAIDRFVVGVSQTRLHVSYVGHLIDFFQLEAQTDRAVGTTPTVGNGADPVVPLRIRNLTFTYPGTTEPTLRDVSLDIEPGETVALVGRNGSGKTTLVKLVAGLYEPAAGSIEVMGTRPLQGSPQLQRDVSIVFQNFGRYELTVGENVAIGDWQRLLDDPEAVADIARRVGLDELVNELPSKYDTALGRSFGEVTLSGGQWQTIAIARAFARPASLLILDEPTANLDAESEFRVFEHFKELAAGRATLLISHRFSTLALADRIAVLDEGRITETGTHAELVDSGGLYSRLHRLYRAAGAERA